MITHAAVFENDLIYMSIRGPGFCAFMLFIDSLTGTLTYSVITSPDNYSLVNDMVTYPNKGTYLLIVGV